MIALRTALFTLFVPGAVVGVAPWLLTRWAGGAAFTFPSVWMIGVLPIAFGAGLYLWCATTFTVVGRGTPAPLDPPTVLVARGVYRWVRNPMYIGVLSVVIGEALLFHSWILAAYAALLWLLFHAAVALVEEPALRRTFGASYEAYTRAVPRWLPRIPWMRRRHTG